MTWASEVISSNSEIRAMAIAIMNTSSSLMWIWTPLVLWPVTDAPFYRKVFYRTRFTLVLTLHLIDRGFTTSVFLIILFISFMTLVAYMQRRDSMVKRKDSNDFAEQGSMPLLQENGDDDILFKPDFEEEDHETQTLKTHRTASSSNI